MISIKLLKISQFDAKDIYIGKVAYSQIKGKTRSTAKVHEDDDAYQRALDKKKLSEIVKFLDEHKSAIAPFPTPLILATNTEIDTPIAVDIKYFDDDLLKQFENENIDVVTQNKYFLQKEAKPVLLGESKTNLINKKDEFYVLNLPDCMLQDIFIVDGQHRFFGFEKYIEYKKNQAEKENIKFDEPDIDFAVTFLLNYDVYEQAEVFANINFEQKPVNKSLYFAIFGVLPGRNKINFAHHLAKAVNDSKELNGLIKMLGKGAGVVSLAFFVETIINELVDFKGKIYDLQKQYAAFKTQKQIEDENLTITYDEQDIQYKVLPEILIDYLAFYQENFNKYFPHKISHKDYSLPIYSSYHYKFYMFKATGLFGILKILNNLFEEKLIDIDNYNKEEFYKMLEKEMKIISNEPEYFFNNSHMLGSGSASLQNKFYNILFSAIFEKEKKTF